MNSFSSVALAVASVFLLAWGATTLREEPVKIVPAPAHVAVEPSPVVQPSKSEALETLGQVQVGAMDRALFLKSFAAAR